MRICLGGYLMGELADAQAPQGARLLLIANSGAGKSGALAALANEGYELFILDFDNGLDPLYTYVQPEYKKLVHFHTLQDEISHSTGEVQIVRADAFTKAMRLISNWDSGGKSLGSVATWNSNQVLVVDSLTFASLAALHLASVRNKQVSYRPKALAGAGDPRQIIGEAQILVEGLLAAVTSEKVKCNVVVTSHVVWEGPDTNLTGFPSSVGRKLSPTIPRYFNTMLYMEQVGPQRVIRRVFPNIPTKAPADFPDNLPISTGLATVVKAITREPTPKEKSK
jgi:hypothetical protein